MSRCSLCDHENAKNVTRFAGGVALISGRAPAMSDARRHFFWADFPRFSIVLNRELGVVELLVVAVASVGRQPFRFFQSGVLLEGL